MAKIKSSIVNMVLVLTIITALVGAILGSVYKLTEAPISQANAKAQEEAIRYVAPDFDNNPIAESDTITVEGQHIIIYPALKDGKNVGAAVKASTNNGFNGEIVVIAGFEVDGTIRQYRVLSHSETPGLGAKMEQWFRTDKNNQSILGRNPETCNLTVSKDGGDIDAITASTITSRAFLQVISTAYQAYMKRPLDALSSSTKKSSQTTQPTQQEEANSHE
ncbi:MAG: RnfABCDGE type electron transport complex subunit G [Bacteroidaceae bacterium]|nr:RnfABCDGE type electron transport complex subunit G [Bacteroidaceae bacterium]